MDRGAGSASGTVTPARPGQADAKSAGTSSRLVAKSAGTLVDLVHKIGWHLMGT